MYEENILKDEITVYTIYTTEHSHGRAFPYQCNCIAPVLLADTHGATALNCTARTSCRSAANIASGTQTPPYSELFSYVLSLLSVQISK